MIPWVKLDSARCARRHRALALAARRRARGARRRRRSDVEPRPRLGGAARRARLRGPRRRARASSSAAWAWGSRCARRSPCSREARASSSPSSSPPWSTGCAGPSAAARCSTIRGSPSTCATAPPSSARARRASTPSSSTSTTAPRALTARDERLALRPRGPRRRRARAPPGRPPRGVVGGRRPLVRRAPGPRRLRGAHPPRPRPPRRGAGAGGASRDLRGRATWSGGADHALPSLRPDQARCGEARRARRRPGGFRPSQKIPCLLPGRVPAPHKIPCLLRVSRRSVANPPRKTRRRSRHTVVFHGLVRTPTMRVHTALGATLFGAMLGSLLLPACGAEPGGGEGAPATTEPAEEIAEAQAAITPAATGHRRLLPNGLLPGNGLSAAAFSGT